YPDVMVSCSPDDADEYYLEKPCLIVEVTSKSTEWKDRHEKAVVYQSIQSLQAYLVVSQEKPHVTLYYRESDDGGWWVVAHEEMDQIMMLTCPEMSLSLADIYEGVDFSQAAE
ncbi:MAG: Uma2 family endonuclease, partial [Gammaproteobacteria bacterium]|nr:Uma2 family endonuclease [Gammaproteobacteria bacterium]MBU2004822.1 Uma2 family endonuclease [Gammaproteobacteria bacterium]